MTTLFVSILQYDKGERGSMDIDSKERSTWLQSIVICTLAGYTSFLEIIYSIVSLYAIMSLIAW